MVDVPITICTAQGYAAQLQARSVLFLYLSDQSLDLAGLLERFAVTTSTFYSLPMVDVPITVFTAQLQARSLLGRATARLGRGAARKRFTGILDHDVFGCSCELELTVEPPAREVGKRAWKENPEAQGQLGPKQNLGRNTSLSL
jgi:hypothetical protein